MEVIYKHFRTDRGAVTVCYECKEQSCYLIHEIGVAFCSPKEKNFSKKKGRLIATGRLNRGKNTTFGFFSFADLSEPQDIGIPQALVPKILYLLNQVNGPTWFSEFLEELIWPFNALRDDIEED